MSTGPDPTPVGPQPGAAPTTDQVLIMLVGGPRNGHQERVAFGTTVVSVDVDGEQHTYALEGTLPDDFAQRIPAPHYPTKYFGYAGPDQQYIDALAAEYPPPPPEDGITRGPEHGPAYGAKKDMPTRPSGADPADRSPGAAERGPEHGPAYGEARGKPAKPLTSEDFPR